MSAILDCTLHSVSVTGIHLLNFKESSPEWNHYTAKQSVHLPLPLYLKLSISICVQLSPVSLGSDKTSSTLPHANAVPLQSSWFPNGNPVLGLWRYWGAMGQSRPRPGCAFCWHKCIDLWINFAWSMPKIMVKVVFKDMSYQQYRFRTVFFT